MVNTTSVKNICNVLFYFRLFLSCLWRWNAFVFRVCLNSLVMILVAFPTYVKVAHFCSFSGEDNETKIIMRTSYLGITKQMEISLLFTSVTLATYAFVPLGFSIKHTFLPCVTLHIVTIYRFIVITEIRPIRNRTRLCTWRRSTCVRTAFLVKGTFIVTFASVETVGYCSGHRTMSTFACLRQNVRRKCQGHQKHHNGDDHIFCHFFQPWNSA